MKKNIYMYGIAVMVAATMAACGGKTHKPTNKDLLVSNEWNVKEIVTSDTMLSQIPERGAWIAFSDTTNQMSGVGGCNNFFGTFEVTTDSTLRIHPMGATMMFCDSISMDFEQRYMSALEQVTGFAVQEKELILTGDNVTLRFDALEEVVAQ